MEHRKIFETLLVFLLTCLAIFISLSEEDVIPGRVSMNTYVLERPWTFSVAGAVLFFAATIALMNLNRGKYRVLSSAFLIVSVILFGIGFFNASS